MKTNSSHLIMLLLVVVFAPAIAVAGDGDEKGVKLPPGLWQFDLELQMPMQNAPEKRTMNVCIGEEPVTPADLMPWAEQFECSVRKPTVKKNLLTWRLICNVRGARQKGKGRFEVDGEEARGNVRIDIDMGARRLAVQTDWDARRTGECPPS